MLALRPNCECCDCDLPNAALVSDPASTERVTKPHPQCREPLVA